MKKFLSIILAVLYFATSNGATIHMHYCMGEMVEKTLWNDHDQQCSKCHMDKDPDGDNGCCKDDHQQVSLEKEHLATQTAIKEMQLLSSALPVSFFEIPVAGFVSITEEYPTGNAPPRSSGIPVFIRNRVFRI